MPVGNFQNNKGPEIDLLRLVSETTNSFKNANNLSILACQDCLFISCEEKKENGKSHVVFPWDSNFTFQAQSYLLAGLKGLERHRLTSQNWVYFLK